MEYLKKFFINLAAGTLLLLIALIGPITAHYLTNNGAVVFILWIIQTALICIVIIFLIRKTFKHWIWLIVIASLSIAIAPPLAININYIALRLLPKKIIKIDIDNFYGIKQSINSYYVSSESIIQLYRELKYYKEERYEEQNKSTGIYEEKISKTEYHFIPLAWFDEIEDKGYGVVEYNDQVQKELKSQNYNYLADDINRKLNLYLIPAGFYLHQAANIAYQESRLKVDNKIFLIDNYLVYKNLFFAEENMVKYINYKNLFCLIFFLALWFIIILLPALIISRKIY